MISLLSILFFIFFKKNLKRFYYIKLKSVLSFKKKRNSIFLYFFVSYLIFKRRHF